MPDDTKRPTALLPVFPLPTVVLFPRLRVPLHIFEPRYRQMIEQALRDDNPIGMVTIVPDRIAEASGDPPIYEIGCTGIIRDSQQLPDGRYNIVVEGTSRFRLVNERPRSGECLYRVADVELIDEGETTDLTTLRRRVTEQVDAVARRLGKSDGIPLDAFDDLDDETFTNSLANGFNFVASEKQGLLEANSVRERLEQLSNLFDYALAELQAGRTPNSGPLH